MCTGYRDPSFTGMPTPSNQWRSHMLHNLLQGPAIPVALGILEQFAQLLIGQPFPHHWHVGRRHLPVVGSWRHVETCQILFLVAGVAPLSGHSLAVRSSAHIHCMSVLVVTLSRIITAGVAAHTAGVPQYRNERFKRGNGNGVVALRSFLFLRVVASNGLWRVDQDREQGQRECIPANSN